MPDFDILRQLASDVGTDTALKLLQLFQTDTQKRLNRVDAEIQSGDTIDISDLRLQAHSLKGLCLTYGATDGARAAQALFEACDAGEVRNILGTAHAALATIRQDIAATLEMAKNLKE